MQMFKISHDNLSQPDHEYAWYAPPPREQSPHSTKNFICIVQTCGQILQYLSIWLTTTRSHLHMRQEECRRGHVSTEGQFLICVQHWSKRWRQIWMKFMG